MLQRSANRRSHRQQRQLIQKRRQVRRQRHSGRGNQPAVPQRHRRSRQPQPLASASSPSSPPRFAGPRIVGPQQSLTSRSGPSYSNLASQPRPRQRQRRQQDSASPQKRSKYSSPSRHQTATSTRQRWRGIWLYGLRALVVGMGGIAIAGTAVSILKPGAGTDSLSRLSLSSAPFVQLQPPSVTSLSPSSNQVPQRQREKLQLQSDQELTTIKTEIQQLAAGQSGLTPSLFFYRPDTGAYLDIAGKQPVSAASTIKVPVLIAFFQAVDAGKVRLDQQLVMRKDLVASEAGMMQYQPVGTQFSALETAELMITISDNTATNMLIDLLGGAQKLNRRFKTWGLTQTEIQNLLPDLEGTNTVSPRDLALLMLQLSQGKLVSPESQDRALEILRQTVTNTLLPQGLPPEATIAHKTGDIGSVVGDVGLIEMPNGQQYVAAVMVQRPHNDPRAQELIRAISRLTYAALSQP